MIARPAEGACNRRERVCNVKYIISQRALNLIELECRRNPDTETGGILVGFRDDNQAAITHATGPGLQWEKSSYHFVKDTEYLQSVLNLLFEYFGANYLGVWHKHPRSMPFPSNGDISSAMEEVTDASMGLEELITPICVVNSGQVDVLPFIIKDREYQAIEWSSTAHEDMPKSDSLREQWYNTEVGSKRLIEELERFDSAGIEVELLKGNDETYRLSALLVPDSAQRLVIVCPAEYPTLPPEVALYDKTTDEYEPVRTKSLDNWNIFAHLLDLHQEYQSAILDSKNSSETIGQTSTRRPLPQRNWVRHGHQAAKLLYSLSKGCVWIAKWPSEWTNKVSIRANQLEKWFEHKDKWT